MKAMDSSSLRIGAWRVDPALDQISKDGNTVKLERRAMQLLLCLAEHAGQVVSVEELLDQVWAGVVVTPDSVYHAVAALRRMLGDDTKEPTYISNVPRRGYRLVAPVAPWVDAPNLSSQTPPSSQEPVPNPAGTVARRGQSTRDLPIATPGYDRTIAVLPFVDMSEKRDQEYFAEGMAVEIADLLARIPGIRVMSRRSSFQFKGHHEDVRTLGAQLGVAYMLEGSVRKSGDRVRVTAQLIDVSDGSQRWSGSYDRDLVDVLKVQDEISWGLVRALQVSMGADEPPRSRPPLQSVVAYALYLRGREVFNRYDRQGYYQAESYFRQAMELDAESALAPAWLAVVHFSQAIHGFVQPDTGFEEARRYAERARRLDPQSEVAPAVLGAIYIVHDWDWAAGARELDRAIALAPGNARILLYHSFASLALGQWDTALRDLNASVALDPLFPAGYYLLGWVQLGAGHWSEAEAAFKRALDIAPNYASVHAFLAEALLFRGDTQAALRQIDLESVETAQWAGRAAINHALGRKADSDAALRRLTELTSKPTSAHNIACVHAYRGESNAAFVWLERAFTQKDPRLWRIKGEPYLNALKGDPRYEAFLRKMNLPQ